MPTARLFLLILVALAAAGCARQQQAYVIDPSTGQPVAMWRQQTAPPQYAQNYQQPTPQAAVSDERGLFNSQPSATQPQYVQPNYASHAYVQRPSPQPYMMQSGEPQYARQNDQQPQAVASERTRFVQFAAKRGATAICASAADLRATNLRAAGVCSQPQGYVRRVPRRSLTGMMQNSAPQYAKPPSAHPPLRRQTALPRPRSTRQWRR